MGTDQDNTMVGTARADDIRSLGGNDVVRARAGNDTISAGEGMDELGGSRGNDTMHAGRGEDELTGGFGNDTLSGAGASDTYFFGDYWGDDRIDVEGNGEDTLDFTPACCSYLRVNLDPSPQRPEAHAYGGNLNFPATVKIENVRGGRFDDTISGNAGRNKLYGGQGDDDLFGLGGNDDLIGGTGWDGLYGGDNADILTDTSPDDGDLLRGGDANDILDANDSDLDDGLDCGPGDNDTAYFDRNSIGQSDRVSASCENQRPNDHSD